MSSLLGFLLGPLGVATESTDAIFAPIQAAYLLLAYQRLDAAPAAVLGGIEEILPGTDFVPTCTMYHVYAMRKKYGQEPAALPPGEATRK